MVETPSTISKGSKTPKRSRHSPPDAPTPKPLQKLYKQNKQDNLILNFLETPTKRREETRAGRRSSRAARGAYSNKETYVTKRQKKKTIGQRRKSLSPPKTLRKVIKPLRFQSRANSAPRTLLSFSTSSEEDDISYDKRNTRRIKKPGNSELSTIRKKLAKKWEKNQIDADEDSKDSNDTEGRDGWEFEEVSEESKAPAKSNKIQIKNQLEKTNDTTSISSSIPNSSGLTKESKVLEGEALPTPTVSQDINSEKSVEKGEEEYKNGEDLKSTENSPKTHIVQGTS